MEGTPCKVIVDDILVYGTNMADQDANLKIVLKRLHKINLRLNVDKCKFRIPEVKYVGNVFTNVFTIKWPTSESRQSVSY